MDKKFLKVPDVAEIFDVHQETVRIWIRDGKLKASFIGRCYMILEKDVQKFIESNAC